MPLPDLNMFCVKLAPQERPCIVFPGGATVCAPYSGGKVPSADELTNALLASANSAIAPLTPIFDILDVVVAVVDCFKGVEDALTSVPPDPSKLVACFPALARALAKVLQILPQLSVPVMIGSLLDVLIIGLTGIQAQLLAFLLKQLRIVAAQTRAMALGSLALGIAADCAQGDLDASIKNLNENAKPLGRMIEVLNALLDLIGLPELPSIADLGTDAQAAVAPLGALIQDLTLIRKAFP